MVSYSTLTIWQINHKIWCDEMATWVVLVVLELLGNMQKDVGEGRVGKRGVANRSGRGRKLEGV